MAHSNKAADSPKPRKPSDNFPLTPRTDGRWCKRYKDVGGRWQTFYARGTAQEALDEWLRVKDDLLAGRTPRYPEDAVTVRDICNKFLVAKKSDIGVKINARTFMGYKKTTDALVAVLGRERAVADLRPDDFAKLYRKLAGKHGVATLGREITIVRSVFKFALDSDHIDRPVKFGPELRAPSKRDKRKQRNKNKREHGARTFAADELRRMIDAAGPQLKAMILLGINGGLGNTDCASLHLSHVDLDAGWLDFPRPKTEIDRRIPLWPETVDAMRKVVAHRRQASDSENAKLVFLTRLGQPWVRFDLMETKNEVGKLEIKAASDDAIAKAMRKLLNMLGIHRRRVAFYALRHTFETIAGGCRDQVAVDAIMGHVDDTMAAEYREHIEDERLLAAVNHVRAWLFPATQKALRPEKPNAAGKRPAKAKPSASRSTATSKAEGPLLRIVG